MTNIHSFRDLTNNLSPEDGGYTASISKHWRQGRTAYGGLTTGLALAAIQKDFPDLPALRTFQFTFIGPVTETPVFKTELLRQGRNVTSVRVNAICDGNISASGIFMFGANRESELSVDFPAPEAAEPETLEAFIPEFVKPMVPKFFNRFDTRLIDGHRPTSAAKEGYMRCWSRHEAENARTGTDSFVCIGDVLPPAALTMFNRMGPISSMNWHMNILVDNLTTQDGWWQVEARQTAAQNGYSSQIMRFWNTDGTLVAEGTQLMAIFV